MSNLVVGALGGVLQIARFSTSCCLSSASSSDNLTRDRLRFVEEEVGELVVAVENVGMTSEMEGVGSRPPLEAPPV